MANMSSLFFVCSCIAFVGVIFGTQAESPHFTFPPRTNFSLKGATVYGLLPLPGLFSNPFIRLSNGDITQATFSWVTYNQSISLWNDNSSFLANFSSHFEFSSYSNDNYSSQYGDGLTFFLAPFDSEPPLNCTGQWLGLFNQSTDGSSSNQIVAVEFDTFKNDPFDPDDNHVGINVNNIVSKTNVSLWGLQIRGGKTLHAWVDYDGLAKRLHVFLTANPVGLGKPETPILSYGIDLKEFLPQKIKVGISASTAYSLELHDVYYWDFQSHHSPQQILTTPTNKNHVLILVFAFVFMVAGFALLAGLRYFRNKSPQKEDIEMDKWFSEGPRKFSHAELKAATKNFSQEQKLGGGGFGDVYRGILPGEKEAVAVKKISQRSKQGKKEYVSEVTIISKLRHRNLVQLLGWSHCHRKGELLLVYEFLPKGSLDKYIFGGICLDWDRRYSIVCNIAAALIYLHEDCKERVVHRDVKASNIMLDCEYTAKLGDFGLARVSLGSESTLINCFYYC